MNLHNCIDNLLKEGLVDWIQAAEIASVARTVGGAIRRDEVRDLSFRIIRELLGQNLMEVGMVTEAGFTVWEIPLAQALRRIESEWLALSNGPGLGEICWLNLTEKGAVRAGKLWPIKEGPDASKAS